MSVNIHLMIRDGSLFSAAASAYIILMLWVNPRFFLRHYPAKIRNSAPPLKGRERLQAKIFGVPFVAALFLVPFFSAMNGRSHSPADVSFAGLFLHAFAVASAFNLVDLLILDWLMMCTFPPRFATIPGTSHLNARGNYFHHFRGFMIGTLLSAVVGLITAAVLVRP